MLEEVSLRRFLSRPFNRCVRGRNAVEWCVGRILGMTVVGQLTREDVELFEACIAVVEKVGPNYVSIADLRGYAGFGRGLIERWFDVGLRYLQAARGSQRLCVTVLPEDFEARASLTGLYSLSGASLKPSVATLSEAWALVDGPCAELDALERLVPAPPAPGLSRRQLQVAHLAARGDSDGLIAKHLGIRESTVGSHLQRVYLALGVHNRVDLANVLHDLQRRRTVGRRQGRSRPSRNTGAVP